MEKLSDEWQTLKFFFDYLLFQKVSSGGHYFQTLCPTRKVQFASLSGRTCSFPTIQVKYLFFGTCESQFNINIWYHILDQIFFSILL